jgi:Ca2+/Na+ antiporter
MSEKELKFGLMVVAGILFVSAFTLHQEDTTLRVGLFLLFTYRAFLFFGYQGR